MGFGINKYMRNQHYTMNIDTKATSNGRLFVCVSYLSVNALPPDF